MTLEMPVPGLGLRYFPSLRREIIRPLWSVPASPSSGFPLSSGIGEPTMQATHNTLSETIRVQSVELLNKHLAAAIDLHSQVKQAHWNVRGPGFIALHQLFDKVSSEIEDYSDMIAERAGGLGGTARGTVRQVVETSFLIPYSLGVADERQHIFAVSSSLAAFGESIREASLHASRFGDGDTADLFTEISRGIGRQLWLVESHVLPK
jgi:starvation-inducible DNA-binding protein